MKAIALLVLSLGVTFTMFWGWLDDPVTAFWLTTALLPTVYLFYLGVDRLIEFVWGNR